LTLLFAMAFFLFGGLIALFKQFSREKRHLKQLIMQLELLKLDITITLTEIKIWQIIQKKNQKNNTR